MVLDPFRSLFLPLRSPHVGRFLPACFATAYARTIEVRLPVSSLRLVQVVLPIEWLLAVVADELCHRIPPAHST